MKAADSFFSMNSDGALSSAIRIPFGAYRNPVTTDSLMPQSFADGSQRSAVQGEMDGMAVYDFTQREVLPDIRKVLAFSHNNISDIQYRFFHQANKLMIDMFAMELNITNGQIPISLDRFGNTSTVSIPLGICADFGENGVRDFGQSVMSAFGGGLSWGSCILSLDRCYIGKLEGYRK